MGWSCGVRSMAIMALMAVTLSSCWDDMVEKQELTVEEEELVWGKKLLNPFSVVNMRHAYEQLKSDSSSGSFPFFDIKPTHWYVRFAVTSEIDYDRLAQDSTLQLFDFPLDYENASAPENFYEPSITNEKPMYRYAAVPVDFRSAQGVAFEILDELYLPDHANGTLQRDARANEGLGVAIAQLEDAAYALAGYTEDSSTRVGSSQRKNSKWYPSGRVTVFDNRLGKFIPVQGVKIQARRWFDVATAVTDTDGKFEMKEGFRHPVNYRLIWETNRFDIRSGTFGQAQLPGPKKKGEWNVAIERNGIQFHYAHVFRGAMRYYYNEIGGLTRPAFRLKYSVFNKQGDHVARNLGNWSAFGINPNILLYRYNPSDGTENDSDEMFSATCHETAHTTHMQIMRGGLVQFMQVSSTVRESWAIGIEWYLTQLEYKQQGISNYGDASYDADVGYPLQYGFQFWNRRRNAELTSLFIDLVDNNNQNGQSFGRFRKGTVNDPVRGYTFAQIESAVLKHTYGLSSLRDNLVIVKPGETTEAAIDILFQNF